MEPLRREDHLLCVAGKAFLPATTDSRHRFTAYPNLARKLAPTTCIQRRVEDIPYGRPSEEFVYPAMVLDGYRSQVIGWSLAGHLRASLALEALATALRTREVIPDGLVHHADQGVQ